MVWAKVLFVVLAFFLAWLLFRNIRANPALFSKHNLSRAAYTMGILALLLIAFVGFCVLLLRG